MADSWLTDGDCKTCRRKSYCKKECKKHKERSRQERYEFFHAIGMGRILRGMGMSDSDAYTLFGIAEDLIRK